MGHLNNIEMVSYWSTIKDLKIKAKKFFCREISLKGWLYEWIMVEWYKEIINGKVVIV